MSASDKLLAYVAELAAAGEVFDLDKAAAHLRVAPVSVVTRLRHMDGKTISVDRRQRYVKINTKHATRIFRYQVTILATGAATLWAPDAVENEDAVRRQEDELFAKRAKVAEDRAEHRRYWLERERARNVVRSHERNTFFVDKETARALNGGFA